MNLSKEFISEHLKTLCERNTERIIENVDFHIRMINVGLELDKKLSL